MPGPIRNDVPAIRSHRCQQLRTAAVSLALLSAGACAEDPQPSKSDSVDAGSMGTTGSTTSPDPATHTAAADSSSLSATSMASVTSATAATGAASSTSSAAVSSSGQNTLTGTTGMGGATSSTGSDPTTTGAGGSNTTSTTDASTTATGGGGGSTSCEVGVHDPANPPATLTLSGNLGTHDPVMIEADGVWYEFQTGPRIYGKTSDDLLAWDGTPSALGAANPAWVADRVPGATDLWAPDISFFGGQYHLYYSASTFGSNTSCIGHATRPSLSSGSWSDQGPVVCSQDSDDFNAIDPNVIIDEAGTPWLAFGSFWDGIRAIELTPDGARASEDLHPLASRGGGAIEAPFIVRRCDYYYLFVSFDSCCQGADSTYNIRVGRSASVLGPYVDRDGEPMLDGGGTLLVSGDATWKGPGHNAVIFDGNAAYNVYHAYAASDGAATLRISELVWDAEGWPISGGP